MYVVLTLHVGMGVMGGGLWSRSAAVVYGLWSVAYGLWSAVCDPSPVVWSVRVAAQQPAVATGHFAALQRVAALAEKCTEWSASAQPSLFHDRVVPELCLSLPDGGTRAACPQLECCNMAAAPLRQGRPWTVNRRLVLLSTR
jgi:hypothetical protein